MIATSAQASSAAKVVGNISSEIKVDTWVQATIIWDRTSNHLTTVYINNVMNKTEVDEYTTFYDSEEPLYIGWSKEMDDRPQESQ